MHAISLLLVSVSWLTTVTTCAQFAPGLVGGRGGGGLYGVTRRTYMGTPNAIAARYFQASGRPLVNPRNAAGLDPAGGTPWMANRAAAPIGPGQPPRSAAALVQPTTPPTQPLAAGPSWSKARGLARVGR